MSKLITKLSAGAVALLLALPLFTFSGYILAEEIDIEGKKLLRSAQTSIALSRAQIRKGLEINEEQLAKLKNEPRQGEQGVFIGRLIQSLELFFEALRIEE